jgi:hypothetical protein
LEISGSKAAAALPSWADEIHASHSSLASAGGFVLCRDCGSLASSYHRKSNLFKVCAFTNQDDGWTMPEGSKWRMQKLLDGLHPVPKLDLWPDGRLRGQALHVAYLRRVVKSVGQDTQAFLVVDSDEDWPIAACPGSQELPVSEEDFELVSDFLDSSVDTAVLSADEGAYELSLDLLSLRNADYISSEVKIAAINQHMQH